MNTTASKIVGVFSQDVGPWSENGVTPHPTLPRREIEESSKFTHLLAIDTPNGAEVISLATVDFRTTPALIRQERNKKSWGCKQISPAAITSSRSLRQRKKVCGEKITKSARKSKFRGGLYYVHEMSAPSQSLHIAQTTTRTNKTSSHTRISYRCRSLMW